MIVCIAEKPSVGRDIAHILGATSDHKSYMEGNGYQVTWTFGHLCELKAPGDYTDLWREWRLESLPMVPPRFGIRLIENRGIEPQFKTIKKLMQAADLIVNCGDAGQEGELIQRWVMSLAQPTCAVKRLWISSMTDEAIREGFRNLKDQADYERLYMAGLSRAIGDWLLGMNATRLYTLKFGRNRQVLSVGRVQTPTLALIVARDREIAAFNPETFWVLATVYRDTTFTATAGRYMKKEDGEKDFALIEGRPFTVTGVQKKNGKEQPPQLYDLTTLQVECNQKFGYSADEALQIIQGLYEHKYVTYPRVDTQYLSDDIYPKCPGVMNGLFQVQSAGRRPYADLVRVLGGKPLTKSKRVFDTSKVTDHHAIIPTGVAPQYLTDRERRVYDLIARRFIAAFYPDCLFATTTVQGEVVPESGTAIAFKATGKQILEPGWRAVYAACAAENAADDTEKKEKEERTLPAFTKGESGPHKPTLTEGQTTPPKHYTEATLLRAMETAGKLVEDETLRAALKENGIGRPSSRAQIIETLYKRHYVRRVRKSLISTETGGALIDIIREDLLKSAELTGIWEKRLRDIERGADDAGKFISDLKGQIAGIVNDVRQDRSNRLIGEAQAEKAGGAPAKAKSKEKTAPKPAAPAAGSAAPATPAAPAPVVGAKCPLCGQGVIVKGRAAFGCSRWREGCAYRVPFGAIQQ